MMGEAGKTKIGWVGVFIFCLGVGAVLVSACAQNPHYVKGQDWARQGKWEEAVAELQAAVRAEPNNKKYQRELDAVQKSLADHYTSLGQKILRQPKINLPQVSQAKGYFQKVLEHRPQHGEAREGLSRSLLLEESLRKEREEAYLQAQKAQNQGRWSSAREKLQKVLELDPAYFPAREAQRFAEKMPAVEVLLKEAKQAWVSGDTKRAKELKQQAAVHLSDFGSAAGAYQKLEAEEKKELTRQRVAWAQFFMKNGWGDEAQKILEEAGNWNPESAELKDALAAVKNKRAQEWVEEGDKLFAAKKFMEAMSFYRLALTLVPDHQGAVGGLDFAVGAQALEYYQRAQTNRQKGLWGNALVELKISQHWVPNFKDSPELVELMWANIKQSLPVKGKKNILPEGLGEVWEQRFIRAAREWEEKGNKELAVEDYCRAMAQDSRLNLWSKVFALKDFQPEKVKEVLSTDSF